MATELTAAEIKKTQHGMNLFVRKYLRGLGPIMEDGKLGPSTFGRVRTCKYYLGYKRPVNGHINTDFRQRLWHPKSVRYSSPGRVRRGMERRIAQRKNAKQNDHHATQTHGVGRFDGIVVAACAIPYMQWAREHGWQGHLVSGWRDPKYSQSLCFRMCGRPSCPGKCAGLSSNHVGSEPSRFAIDVSDYWRFGQLMRQCPHRPVILNRLGARDPVHFSPSGN
jgi:hypothetical protein